MLRESSDRRISGWKSNNDQVTPTAEILRRVYPGRNINAQDEAISLLVVSSQCPFARITYIQPGLQVVTSMRLVPCLLGKHSRIVYRRGMIHKQPCRNARDRCAPAG